MSLLPFLDGLQRLPNATRLVFSLAGKTLYRYFCTTTIVCHTTRFFTMDNNAKLAAMAVFLAVFGCTTLVQLLRGEAPPRSKDLHYAHRAEQPPSSCSCAREPVGREQPLRPIISVHVQRSTATRRPSLQDRCKPRRPPERPWGPSAERRRSRTRACGACWRYLAPVTVANGSCRAGMSP